MKIEEYIERFKLNNKHKEQIKNISTTFKARGLEKFLMLSFKEEIFYMDKTELMVTQNYKSKDNDIHEKLKHINREILKYDNPEYVCLFFSYMPSEKYYIACEVAKKAYYHGMLPNLYDDDDSKNHIVVFEKNQKKEISLLLRLIEQRGISKDVIIGYRIYGIDVSYIVNLSQKGDTVICYKKPNNLTHFCGNQIRKDNDIFRIIETRDIIEQIIDPNLYDDDDSKNHIVVFEKNQKKEISLLLRLIEQRGISKDVIIGYRIYGIDVSYIVNLSQKGDTVICYKKPNNLTHFCGNQIRKDNDIFRIIETRDIIEQIIDKKDFKDELELSYYLRKNIMMPIQDMYHYILDTPSENIDYIEEKNKIYNILVKENRVPVKWKSEKAMFDLIYNYFPDAIYQYRPKWLAPQSLDVYVPSINTGFEYQGVQHFSEIKFFGGNEGLKKRIELDEKKKLICSNQGVNLIEWGYQETITKLVLEKKLKSIGMVIK